MSKNRVVLFSVIFCSALLLAGAMAQQATKPPAPAGGAPPAKTEAPPKIEPPKEDPKATEVLAQAVDRSKKQEWVETTLWQQVDLQGLTCQAEGTYLAAPQRRLHLDLEVHLGGNSGNLKVISDGSTLWEVLKIGTGDWTVRHKIELNKALEPLNTPEMPTDVVKEVQEQFFQTQSFAGVTPLLQTIKQRMKVTKQENVRWNGHDVIRLTAVWPIEVANAATQNGKQPWAANFPKECRLYLDEKTSWPHRLEWFGPAPARKGDALLVQMEFRSPKFQEFSKERCDREFAFDPGPGDVPDQTHDVKENIKNFAMHLKAQKEMKPTTPDKPKPPEKKP